MAGEIVHIAFPSEDADRAQRFWNGLFGWSFRDAGLPEADYRLAQSSETTEAGVFQSEERSGYPNCYFATPDIDASIAKVKELGGQAEEKRLTPGHGWSTSCKDSEGNAFHLWQLDTSASAAGLV